MDIIKTCIDRFDNELLNLHKVFVSQEKIDYKYFDFSHAIKTLIEKVTIANEKEKYKTVIAQYIHTLVELFVKPYCAIRMKVEINEVDMTETTTSTKYYPMGDKQAEKTVTTIKFDASELELKKEVANNINNNQFINSISLYNHIMMNCNCIADGVKGDTGFIAQKKRINNLNITEYNDALNNVSHNSFFHHIEYLKDKWDFLTPNNDTLKQEEVLKIDSVEKPEKPLCIDETKELVKFFFPDSVSSFIECEKRLMSDGYIDENRCWKKPKDKMTLVEFILTLKENGYFKPRNKTKGAKLKDTDLRSFFEKRYNVNISQQMQPSRQTKIRASFTLYPITKQK